MSDKRIFLETMFDGFTPDSVSREELISILLDDHMVVARDNLSIDNLAGSVYNDIRHYPNIIVDNSLRKPIGFVLEDGSIS